MPAAPTSSSVTDAAITMLREMIGRGLPFPRVAIMSQTPASTAKIRSHVSGLPNTTAVGPVHAATFSYEILLSEPGDIGYLSLCCPKSTPVFDVRYDGAVFHGKEIL